MTIVIVIGIDIGLTGAVSAVDHTGSATVHDLPVIAAAKGNRIDGRALIHTLRDLVPPGAVGLAVIEDILPRPRGNSGAGNTIHSQGSLMRSRGTIEAVMDIARLDHRVVQPQEWKAFYGLIGKDKKASLEVARRLFPSVAGALTRQKDQNRAESLLIAHFWLRKHLA